MLSGFSLMFETGKIAAWILFYFLAWNATKPMHLLLACVLPRLMDTWVRKMRLVRAPGCVKLAEHDSRPFCCMVQLALVRLTLARIIAHTTHAEFVEVSAITGTVKDLRREIIPALGFNCR